MNISEKISEFDKSNMFEILKEFPKQVKEAVEIGKSFEGFRENLKTNKIYLLGMGGSAIAGDLLATYLTNHLRLNLSIEVVRGYDIPSYVNEDDAIIASSYSGGTEETISTFRKALERKMNVIAITTGGELFRIADANNVSLIKIPEGYQPRCAVGYSFFPLLLAIVKSINLEEKIVNKINDEINDTIKVLGSASENYSNKESNFALNLAKEFKGFVPIIYSSYDKLGSVSIRWVRQIQENAKHLAFYGLLPEMNHNEINSFDRPLDFISKLGLIILKDIEDHDRIKIRLEALKELLTTKVNFVKVIESKSQSSLARIFDLLYLGDWFSYYLAIVNDTDPTPIPIITKLKGILSAK